MNFVKTLEIRKQITDFFENSKCVLCEKKMPDIEVAMDEGWMPQFYVGDTEYQIACSDCSEKYLEYDEKDGEVVLKPEFVKTFMDSSSSNQGD